MKAPTLVAIGIAMLSSLSHVQAQSSVSLYGVVDSFGQYLSGDSQTHRLQSGGLSGSRFGLRGQEDLGAGLTAVFVLESGINVDDGSTGQNVFWGRQAYVGLRSSTWGQVSFGRQYSSLYFVATEFSIFSNVAGPSTAVIGGFGGYEPVRGSNDSAAGNGGPSRVNNSIRYESPEWSGLRGGVMTGLGETSGHAGDNRLLDIWGHYANGPFSMMASYIDDKGGAVNDMARRKTFGVGATYEFGDARAMAGYIQVNDTSAANQDGRGWWVGADYTLGRHKLKAQYVQSEPRYTAEARTQAFGVGWEYMLSKRATLYSSLTRFKNDDHAGAGRAWFALPPGLTTPTHNDITEFGAGMRLTF